MREEFDESLEQPDPIPLLVLLENGARNADPGDSNVGPGIAQKVGDDATGGAGEGLRRRRDASPTRSAQLTDKANPEAPGWSKRCQAKNHTSFFLSVLVELCMQLHMQYAFYVHRKKFPFLKM